MPIGFRGCLKAGQRWKYKTRHNKGESWILILKIDEVSEGNIIHVTICGDVDDAPMHMPFTELVIRENVTELCESDCFVPDFEEGYLHWKKQYDIGNAGVYSISVDDALNL